MDIFTKIYFTCKISLLFIQTGNADKVSSGGGPVHARVPIHTHTIISPKQSQLHNKLLMHILSIW